MMNMLLAISTIYLMAILYTYNPVKSGILALMLSSTIFFMAWMNTSQTWLTTIIYLMFMGGVLIMFMILSSIMPNEKPGLIKISLTFALPLMVIALKPATIYSPLEMKWTLSSQASLSTLVCLILMFFFSFLAVLKEKGMPIRK